jgi:hypothetical protein
MQRSVESATVKRRRSWIFWGLAAASLAPGVVAATLWVRSYTVADSWTVRLERTVSDPNAEWTQRLFLTSDCGTLIISVEDQELSFTPAHIRPVPPGLYFFHIARRPTTGYRGFGYFKNWKRASRAFPAAGISGGMSSEFVFYFPPAVLFVPGSFALWALVRRRKPPMPGFCNACGYDLRATPDRCPECGAISLKSK